MPEDIIPYSDAVSTLEEDISPSLATPPLGEPEKQHGSLDAEWEDLTMSLTPVLEVIQSGMLPLRNTANR
jgi:hypothetical protein